MNKSGKLNEEVAPLVFATSGGMGKQATVSLQMPCLLARIEEGPALQPRDWLDQMPLGFLSSPIVHHLPEGYKVHCRMRPRSHLS